MNRKTLYIVGISGVILVLSVGEVSRRELRNEANSQLDPISTELSGMQTEVADIRKEVSTYITPTVTDTPER